MAYRYTKRKIPYSKMTLLKLKEIEANILSKNPDLEIRLGLYQEDEKRLIKLRDEYQAIQHRLNEIRNIALERKQRRHTNASALKKFFMDKTTPNFTESELAEVERLRAALCTDFKHGYDSNKYQSAYETRERLERVQGYISQKERKEAKKQTEKAVIAAYKGKSRSLADQIKSELRVQTSIDPRCPYCGGNIGHDPHCDHIYPVTKGGLSTQRNMVYVCSDCNLKKAGLTLTQFVKTYGFSRVEIERRLDILGKDY